MMLSEWVHIKGLDEKLFAIIETIYNKGYRDGERKRHRVLNDEELNRVADDLIERVINNEIND